jgi:hypothetical protein
VKLKRFSLLHTYNAGATVVNSEVVGLAPGVNFRRNHSVKSLFGLSILEWMSAGESTLVQCVGSGVNVNIAKFSDVLGIAKCLFAIARF